MSALVGVGLLTALVLPQQADSLTLAEAVAAALTTAPTVQLAAADRLGASARVREVNATRRPGLGWTATAIRFAEPMLVAPLHGFNPAVTPDFSTTLYQSNLSAGYTLLDFGSGAGRVAQAHALHAAASHVEDASRQGVIAEVVAAASRMQAARARRDAERERLVALQAEDQRVSEFLAAGRAPQVDRLRVRAALAQVETDLAAVGAELLLAEQRLGRLTGLVLERVRGLNTLRPAGTPVAERESLLAIARRTSPEVRRADERLQAARAGLSAARAAGRPIVRLEGQLVTYGASGAAATTEWLGGLRFTYPLFTSGRRGAEVDQAQAALASAEAARTLAERAVATRIDEASARWEAATAARVGLREAVRYLEEVRRVEALALAQGAGVQADYLRAVADLAMQRARLAEAEAEAILARMALAEATGQLTPSHLATLVLDGASEGR